MKNKIKIGLSAFFFVILLLPLVQQCFPFIISGILYGFAQSAIDVSFSPELYWTGNYQDQKSKYLNDNIGFRPDLIRLYNQVNYFLFRKTHSWNVIEGGNHNLFMATSIDGYYGTDYVGYSTILEKMRKLKAVSDTLSRMGKSLVLVHAPAKVFMYPEDIPEIRKSPVRTTTNFETFLRIGDSLKINQVDFNTWFCAMKDKTKELLFPKQGGHWSVYGSYIAADSFIKYIERLRNIHMPHPAWSTIIHSDKPRDPDDDIAKTLNLIYPTVTETFSYPEVHYASDSTTVKPNVIYIGDSFLLSWLRDGIMDNTNTDWQIWQWFSVLWDKNTNKEQSDRKIQGGDWVTAINHTDCLVIVYTSFNLPELGNGFIEKAYDYYYPGK